MFVVNASHMKLGFQDVPEVITKRELAILDETIALCEAAKDAEPARR